eukprot:1821488-Rhodomonas_salina.6
MPCLLLAWQTCYAVSQYQHSTPPPLPLRATLPSTVSGTCAHPGSASPRSVPDIATKNGICPTASRRQGVADRRYLGAAVGRRARAGSLAARTTTAPAIVALRQYHGTAIVEPVQKTGTAITSWTGTPLRVSTGTPRSTAKAHTR